MKKFVLFSLALTIGLVFCLPALSGAQAPELKEELVYRLNVFNGRSYGGEFTPQAEDTIYLIADKNNAISARITLVCFWPITGKYQASFGTLNEEVEGVLEILKGEKVIETLEKEDNSLYHPEGYWAGVSVLYRGEEAWAYHEKYKKAIAEYYMKRSEYQQAQIEYRKKYNEFSKEIKRRKEAGEEITEEEIQQMMPKPPTPPRSPEFFVPPPGKDYIINLPPGNYKIRLRTKDGAIIQDSEKNLILFTCRREGGTGYGIIPGNRWTKRESCDDPSWIIYLAGENTLYFNPYIQDEYNELYYNKLEEPQNWGREEKWKWVRTEPIEGVTLLFSKGKEILQKITKAYYYVKQIYGPELGYEIVKWDPKEMPGRLPTFDGYRLELASTLPKTNYEVNLEKEEGELFPGGKREVHLVRKERANLLYILSIFPLAVGLLVFIGRKKKNKKLAYSVRRKMK